MLERIEKDEQYLSRPSVPSIVAHVETRDGCVLSVKKGDRALVRVNSENGAELCQLVTLLSGILGAELTRDEIAAVRDVLQGVMGS
jgi:hypothetical protein